MHCARKAWTQADSSIPYWNETEPTKKLLFVLKKKGQKFELQCVISQSKRCLIPKMKSFGVAEKFCR